MSTMNDDIEQRKAILMTIKTEIIQRLDIQRDELQIDDDTALFGNGLKLDSVDATEIVVLLDKVFNIKVSESDEPSYMRSINSLVTFVIHKKKEQSPIKVTS
jgi:acyl carrier protein